MEFRVEYAQEYLPPSCRLKMPTHDTCHQSISTVGWEAYANGGNRLPWPGLEPTGNAATANGALFAPNTLPLPLPCRDHFFTAKKKILEYIWCSRQTMPKLGFASRCRESGVFFGGGVAGTRDRAPYLAPAQPPLACPLQPTGGDALNMLDSIFPLHTHSMNMNI